MIRAYSLNYHAIAPHSTSLVLPAPSPAAQRELWSDYEVLLIVKYSRGARAVREALERAGMEHALTVITDGAEALSLVRDGDDLVRSPRPDFIVLEHDLDQIGGRAVLDAIRADPDLGALPLILLGASPAEWNLSQSCNPAQCRVVSNPCDVDALIAAFRSLETRPCA